MKISSVGLELIKSFEGYSNKPYLDSVKIATIGYGTTYYPNGTKVTIHDKTITPQQAETYLLSALSSFEEAINYYVKVPINQNMYDALCSFVYNVGAGNFKTSTLLKLININPNDPKIEKEFIKWSRAGGVILRGLLNRRQKEADLYFKKKAP